MITGVAGAAPYGGSLTIETPDAAAVASVVLVRLASVTHTLDMDQRRLELPFTAGGGGVVAQGPSDPRLAPPGPYMLFLVTAEGVPSVARTVLVGAAPDPTAPRRRRTATATATPRRRPATAGRRLRLRRRAPRRAPRRQRRRSSKGAAFKDVGIVDFRYEPPQVTIAAGDSVRWTNTSPATVHSATGAGGEWDSGPLSAGQGFTAVFPTPGVYPYRCVIHPGMTGVVEVLGPAATPTPSRRRPPPADAHPHAPRATRTATPTRTRHADAARRQ